MFQRVALLGVGLMGGSLGLALRERKLAHQVVGYARRESTRTAALAKGVMDAAAETVEEAVRGADLVVLGTPVRTYDDLLRAAMPYLNDTDNHCIVTDLGSTKLEVTQLCESHLYGTGTWFVGGHPMAGSEETGPEAANSSLFEGAIWCLTPSSSTTMWALDRISKLVEAVGAIPRIMSPEAHDLAVAAVSHVPHLAAAALVNGLVGLPEDASFAPDLASSGFRDTTRVASGSPEMWRDICLTNREGIRAALNAFRDALDSFQTAMDAEDGESLIRLFEAAKKRREEILKRNSQNSGT